MKNILLLGIMFMYLTDGKSQLLLVDSLYGTNGSLISNFPYNEDPVKAILQPDGKILTGGVSAGPSLEYYSALTRSDICGIPDNTFGDSGLVLHAYDFRNTPHDLLIQPDEKIVVTGVSAPSNAGSQHIPFISRYLDDGSPDTAFGNSGAVAQRFDPVSSGGFYSVQQYDDGRLLGIGRSTGNINGGSYGYGAMRFMDDGALDPTFDGDGITRYPPLGPLLGEVRGKLLTDGRIAMAFSTFANGTFLESITASVIDSTGMLDTTYGVNGVFLDTAITVGNVWIESLPNDFIVLATTVAGNNSIDIISLDTQGSLDTTFGTGGRLRYDFTGVTGEVKGIKLIDNTHIMVFGKLNNPAGSGFLLRLNANGSVDSPFGLSGLLEVNLSSNTEYIEDVLLLDNGQYLCLVNEFGNIISTRLIEISNVPHISLSTVNGTDLITTGGDFYQWYFNTLLIPGAISDVFTPVSNGVYTVMATDSTGCSYLSEPYILQNVGIQNNNDDVAIIVQNPMTHQLFITAENDVIQRFYVYDLSGKLINETVVNNTGYNKEINLAPGSYLIRILTEKGTVVRKIEKM